MAKRRPVQGELQLWTRGGWRPGAGRKPKRGLRKVEHVARPHLTGREPVHVTWRLAERVWNLRSQRGFRVVLRGLIGAVSKGLRIINFSVQGNHLHLIVEPESTEALSRGMQGLGVRIARGLNALMGSGGKVFADRFFVRVLRFPKQVKKALNYVLRNAHKHLRDQGRAVSDDEIDPYAAGPGPGAWDFTWARKLGAIVPSATWLMKIGWQRA